MQPLSARQAVLPVEQLVDRIQGHLAVIAEIAPGRPPGSPANRSATAYVEGILRSTGFSPESLPFRALSWQPGRAIVDIDGHSSAIDPPPFCHPADVSGPAAILDTAEELRRAAFEADAVVVLRAQLADEPYFPKAFPFASFPEQIDVIEALERRRAAAVLAVVPDERASDAIFEDPDLAFAFATIPASITESLLPGSRVGLHVDATLVEGDAVNVSVGSTFGPRALACAHVDSKATTPGLLDNGGGVAVLLALAQDGLDDLGPAEFVFFNGEDHYAAPGEQAWLAARDLTEISLVINIDGAGLAGHRAAVSTLNADPALEASVARLVGGLPSLEIGPAWFESDHAVFAMRGIPTVAITSAGDMPALKRLAHAPHETLDRVDPLVLAEVVEFVRRLLQEWRAR